MAISNAMFDERLAVTIGTRISGMRTQAGMTQKDLAAKCGLTQKSVGAWEAGRACPPVRHLYTIAEVFDCTLDDLVPVITK